LPSTAKMRKSDQGTGQQNVKTKKNSRRVLLKGGGGKGDRARYNVDEQREPTQCTGAALATKCWLKKGNLGGIHSVFERKENHKRKMSNTFGRGVYENGGRVEC